jgi:hypothetical protein
VYEAITLYKMNSEFFSARLGAALGEPPCISGPSNVWRSHHARVNLGCRRFRRWRRRLRKRARELNAQEETGDDGSLKQAHESSPSLYHCVEGHVVHIRFLYEVS